MGNSCDAEKEKGRGHNPYVSREILARGMGRHHPLGEKKKETLTDCSVHFHWRGHAKASLKNRSNSPLKNGLEKRRKKTIEQRIGVKRNHGRQVYRQKKKRDQDKPAEEGVQIW